MKNTLAVKFFLVTFIVVLPIVNKAAAQTETEKDNKSNFEYSQGSKTKTKSAGIKKESEISPTTVCKIFTVETIAQGVSENSPNLTKENKIFESRSVVCKPVEVVNQADNKAVSPTEIYKIGVGDVLFISLQNAPPNVSTYFTVLNNGAIDYPLAGELIKVENLTTEEIENLLKAKIKLYENPQISVKVREHASHAITVLGLVENAGEKYLPREAVPLFMIRAEAVVQPKADLLVIKRANTGSEKIDLRDAKSEDVLIFPGDILEFKSSEFSEINTTGKQFYFIGGHIISGGQKDFHQGLTLTQAILASGGIRKSRIRKVVVRRKNQLGLLSPLEFDLGAIKAGKQPDPLVKAGDTIEIVN
jgi:protein involved in polysaccharide export with SLBB domain